VPDEAAAAVSGAEPDHTGAASGLEADDGAGKTVPDAAASPAGIATGDDGSGDAVADAITSGDIPRPNGAERAHEERPEKPAS